jgi:hypothetical protein
MVLGRVLVEDFSRLHSIFDLLITISAYEDRYTYWVLFGNVLDRASIGTEAA